MNYTCNEISRKEVWNYFRNQSRNGSDFLIAYPEGMIGIDFSLENVKSKYCSDLFLNRIQGILVKDLEAEYWVSRPYQAPSIVITARTDLFFQMYLTQIDRHKYEPYWTM